GCLDGRYGDDWTRESLDDVPDFGASTVVELDVIPTDRVDPRQSIDSAEVDTTDLLRAGVEGTRLERLTNLRRPRSCPGVDLGDDMACSGRPSFDLQCDSDLRSRRERR